MNKFDEIMTAYTSGKKSIEDTNAALKAVGAEFHLDPARSKLTAEKIAAGYGLLDSGVQRGRHHMDSSKFLLHDLRFSRQKQIQTFVDSIVS